MKLVEKVQGIKQRRRSFGIMLWPDVSMATRAQKSRRELWSPRQTARAKNQAIRQMKEFSEVGWGYDGLVGLPRRDCGRKVGKRHTLLDAVAHKNDVFGESRLAVQDSNQLLRSSNLMQRDGAIPMLQNRTQSDGSQIIVEIDNIYFHKFGV